eukprot:366311-Chlamydomonas_euryale.AAC.23
MGDERRLKRQACHDRRGERTGGPAAMGLPVGGPADVVVWAGFLIVWTGMEEGPGVPSVLQQ